MLSRTGQRHPNKGWRVVPLGEICDLVLGKTPRRKRTDYWTNGTLPWATIGDMTAGLLTTTKEQITELAVAEAKIPLVSKGTVLLSFKLSIGKVAMAGVDLYTNEAIVAVLPKSERLVLTEYLYFYLQKLDIVGQAHDAVKGKTVNKKILLELPVVLPPLPVQERIVQILQKADEVRRKGNEALGLADTILPSIFQQTFDRSATQWIVKPLREIVLTRSGGTPSRKNTDYWNGVIPWASPSDMKVTEIYDTEEHITEKAVAESATNLVDPGAILVVVRSGILAHTFPVALTRVPLAFNQDIRALIPKQDILIPEYLLWALRARAPHVLMSAVKRGSTVRSINSKRFFEMRMPVPPLPVQESFVDQVEQLVETSQRLVASKVDGQDLFGSLLHRAFTGELTAEWEIANGNEMAAQQQLHGRLPRLIVLALLAEKLKRADPMAAEVLMTALMKYIFLLQMEGNGGGRRVYHFVPYHYGPFAKELYKDLRTLEKEGLVQVENDLEEEKTEIALVHPTKADELLSALPDDLKEDAAMIIESYGDLDHNALLKTVYEKYPAYATKSRLRRGPLAGQLRKPAVRKRRP